MFSARRVTSTILKKKNLLPIHNASIRLYHEPIDFESQANSFQLKRQRGGGGFGDRNRNNRMNRNDRVNNFNREDEEFDDYEIDPNASPTRSDSFKPRNNYNNNNYRPSFRQESRPSPPPVEEDEDLSDRQDPVSLAKSFNTVLDIYRYAISEFTRNELAFGQSSVSVHDDAAFLILHELALPFDKPIDFWLNAKLRTSEKIHLITAIKKRVETRLPTAYLVNGCVQQGEYFYVDKRALIPRSFIGEIMKNMDQIFPASSSSSSSTTMTGTLPASTPTELGYEDYFGQITDEKKFHSSLSSSSIPHISSSSSSEHNPFISPMKQFDPTKVRRVLDLCTGSGCLAILAARFFPNIERIDAVDISDEALKVAEINVKNKGLGNKIHLFQGDLYRALNNNRLKPSNKNNNNNNNNNNTTNNSENDEDNSVGGEPFTTPKHPVYDLIISNPPYVPKKVVQNLPKEFTHEPILALDGGGQDGLNIVKRIFLDAQNYLNPNQPSFLLCEIGLGKLKFEKFYEQEMMKRQQILAQEEAEAKGLSTSEIAKKNQGIPPVTWISTSNSKDEVFFFERNQLPDPTFFIKRSTNNNNSKLPTTDSKE